MSYHVGVASDYLHLQQRLRLYLTGNPSVENERAENTLSQPNTGDGYVRNLHARSAAVAETWTLACTTGGGDGVGVFSVTGSVSGAQPAATVGTQYVETYLEFIILDGPTDYVVGDQFIFDVVANDIPGVQQWTELKFTPGVPQGTNNGMNSDPGVGADNANEIYLKAPGLSGTDDIYINMCTFYSEASDYYNISFCGALGFETNDTYSQQPNKSTDTTMCLWQFQIPYWIIADGRRFIVVCKVSTNYMSAYCGWFLPYGTPQEYPYPMYVSASLSGFSATRWSSEGHTHRSFFDPYAGYVYTIDGTWLLIQNKISSNGNEVSMSTSNIWPYTQNLVSGIRQSPGDVYPMLPLVIHTSSNGGNVYGELTGCYWVPGFANASENTVVVGGIDHVGFQDVYRTSNQDYFALKLD